MFQDTNVTLKLNEPPPTPGLESEENEAIRDAWNKGLLGDTITVAGLPYIQRLVELLNDTEPLILGNKQIGLFTLRFLFLKEILIIPFYFFRAIFMVASGQ